MRACVHAIQAEGTVQIAGLLRLKQIEFATARALVASNAIISPAGLTRLGVFDLNLPG